MEDIRFQDLPQPDVPIEFIPVKGGDIFALGTLTIRIMEDGSHTDNRIGTAELIIPPKTPGPPAHWHEMHDETFLVTQGTVRFHKRGDSGKEETIDAKTGDYVVVPIRSPHTFSNPFDEEARFINTFTPAFYINYFKLLNKMQEAGQPMRKDVNLKAMANFATIPAKLTDG